MLKKNVWIAVLLVAALAFVFVGCQDRPAGDIETVETNSLVFNTNNIDWGGGVDLRHSFFNFAAGDKITVTGYVHDNSSAPATVININTKPGGSLNDILRVGGSPSGSVARGNPFALNAHVLTDTEASDIAAANPAGIRIDARATNAKVVLTEIIVEKANGTVMFKLSEYLDGLPEGPVAHNDTTVFDAAKGLMDASGDGAVTYEILAGTPVLPCTNDECRCLACDSKCPCWTTDCFPRTLDAGNNIIALGCCFVEDIYDAVDFTETGFTSNSTPTPPTLPYGEFYLNLNDYKQKGALSLGVNVPEFLPTTNLIVECPKCLEIEEGTCSAIQLANHVLQPERIKLNFTANNQRVGFKLADWQADLLSTARHVRIEITGTAKTTSETPVDSKTPFRFFIGDMKSGSNWNATDFPNYAGTILAGQGVFTDIVDLTVPFNNNKNADTVKYFILQQRADAKTTVEIESIKITINRYVAIPTLAVTLAEPKSGARPQTIVRGTNFTGDVTWRVGNSILTSNSRFQPGTQYWATIEIKPDAGYVVTGATTATVTGSSSVSFNPVTMEIMTGLFDVTGDDLVEAVVEDGDFDAAINANFVKTASGANILYTLVGKSDFDSILANNNTTAEWSTTNWTTGGAVNITGRDAAWNRVNINTGALGVSPTSNVIKVTVYGIMIDGNASAMQLCDPTGNPPSIGSVTAKTNGDVFMLEYLIPRNYLNVVSSGQLGINSSEATASYRITLVEVENLGKRNLQTVSIDKIEGFPLGTYAGATPITTIKPTFEFTGAVTWKTAAGADHSTAFVAGTTYVATVTLTPLYQYTFDGIEKDFFSVNGAASVENAANSNVVTVKFTVSVAPLACGCTCTACLAAGNCSSGATCTAACLCSCHNFSINLSAGTLTTGVGGIAGSEHATSTYNAATGLEIVFGGYNHQAVMPITTAQRDKLAAVLQSGAGIKVTIQYSAVSGTMNSQMAFRNINAGSNWNGTTMPNSDNNDTVFDSSLADITYTLKKHDNLDGSLGNALLEAFMIRSRQGASTITITAINISFE